MSEMNCPSGFLMSYDKETDQYIPFLMKIREQEIIWFNNNDNLVPISTDSSSIGYILTETDHYLDNISTYYVDYLASQFDKITDTEIYINETDTTSYTITRNICYIPTTANSVNGIYSVIIIDTLKHSNDIFTNVYTYKFDNIPNSIMDICVINIDGKKIYNKPLADIIELDSEALYKTTVPNEEDPDVFDDVYSIEYTISDTNTFNSILNSGYTINQKIIKYEFDILPTKKHVFIYPGYIRPATFEISSDGTCDIYVKFLLKDMKTSTVFDDDTESSSKGLYSMWTLPTGFEKLSDSIEYRITSESLHCGIPTLSKLTSHVVIRDKFDYTSSFKRIEVHVVNPVYPFSYNENGTLIDVDDNDYVIIHIHGNLNR